jgi:mono/diheme cytochrome c family protein
MKHALWGTLVALVLAAGCGGSSAGEPASSSTADVAGEGKGIGEVKNVTLNDPLNPEMVKRGQAIYELKCAACHRLTDQRVVGPGWLGVTERRQPEWIMNMILNVDVMLDKDPEARKLLEECLTRMPNQNLNRDDARDVLELMLSNDAGTVGG